MSRRFVGSSTAVQCLRRKPPAVLIAIATVALLGACGTSADDDSEASGTPTSFLAQAVTRNPAADSPRATVPPSTASPSPTAAGAPAVKSDTDQVPTAAPAGESAPPPVAEDCVPPDALPAVASLGRLVTSDDGVRVRAGPGVECEVVEALDANTEVAALSGFVRADDLLWLLVEVGETEGWVAAEFVGAEAAAPGSEVIVLAYHHLDQPDTEWSVTAAQLTEQLTWLRDQGYESVTISRLVAAIEGEAPLPAKTVVITNDDGYAETRAFAAILDAHGFVGTYYLPDDMELTAADVKALEASGGEICAHSATHRDLTALDAAQQRREIADNAAFLAGIVGHPIRCFAYPFGRANDDTVAILKDLGFESAVLLDGGPVRIDAADPLRIGRVPVSGSLTMRDFAAMFPEGAPEPPPAEEIPAEAEPNADEPPAEDAVYGEPIYEEAVPEVELGS